MPPLYQATRLLSTLASLNGEPTSVFKSDAILLFLVFVFFLVLIVHNIQLQRAAYFQSF